jgi:hypothetical protein
MPGWQRYWGWFRGIFIGNVTGGPSTFGGATDYSEFEADGTLKFNGAAVVWDDIIISPFNLRPGGSAPGFTAITTNIYALSFINGNTDIVYGTFELPHCYKEGTDIDIHVHWAPSSTDTGDCVWSFVYSIQNMNGGAFPGEQTISITQAGGGVAKAHQFADGASNIPGGTHKIGTVVVFSLSRPAGDSFTGDAWLLSVGAHYQKDTVGSRSETTKA